MFSYAVKWSYFLFGTGAYNNHILELYISNVKSDTTSSFALFLLQIIKNSRNMFSKVDDICYRLTSKNNRIINFKILQTVRMSL